MASCAATFGKDLRTRGRSSGWLEVPQARKERQQIHHLLALKYRGRYPLVAALLQHLRFVVPENGGKLCRSEWKLMFRPQLRPKSATLTSYGMAFHTSALEYAPAALSVARYFARIRCRRRSDNTDVCDQIVHFLAGKLGPLSDGGRNRIDHRSGMVQHRAGPRARIDAGSDTRKIGRCFAAHPGYRMTANTTLVVEHLLSCA